MKDYEEIVAFLDQWGCFQKAVFLLLCVSIIPNGFGAFNLVFLTDVPDHHCFIPDLNLSEEWRKSIIPKTVLNGKQELNRCSRYRLDVVQNLSDRGLIPGRDINLTDLEEERCVDGWSYSTDIYLSTVVTEFDLVCSDQWAQPFTTSVFFIGVLVGSFFSGQLSDRYGRKPILFATMAAQTIFTFAQVFSTSWTMFVILLFFNGLGQISNFVAALVLGTELLSKTMRVLFTTLGAFLFYCIGYMTLPWIAFGIRDWRTLLAVLSATSVVYIPLWWFIPESPRWLITQGRVMEAEVIVRDAARKNKVQAPSVIFRESEVGFGSTLRLFLYRCSICLGNPFLNCFLSAITEVPAYIVSSCLLRKCPRRVILSTFLVIGGGVLLLIQFIPDTLHYVALALEMTGKFGFTMAFTIVYIYTAEIYPTVLRNVGMGMCSSAARIGSITAPYVIYLGTYNKVLPYILMGSLTIASSVVNFFLPETFNKDLPETVEQMQELSMETDSFHYCFTFI
uniref:Major facilitator superfamily (MFS) profile domain-containing protein n=1 Tax=Xiphophorus couchianus TaxID=32473 RepID=A0A3B5LAJ0_9TELE